MAKTTYTAQEIAEILLLSRNVISLNAHVKPNSVDEMDETEIGDLIEDTGPGPEELAMEQNRAEILDKYMNKYLTHREKEILSMRFGIDNGNPKSLIEIAKHFGLTRERIRQIEVNAIRKLRYYFYKNKITWENL